MEEVVEAANLKGMLKQADGGPPSTGDAGAPEHLKRKTKPDEPPGKYQPGGVEADDLKAGGASELGIPTGWTGSSRQAPLQGPATETT
ncbi:MAG: hypothetical protein IPN83_26710 [Holophagales bacterium]|nr:hypothetical protein [Holophagales bacterium]